jgi:hypothetical protein
MAEQSSLLPPLVYEIRTVQDFLLVPEDRRAACLAEFGTWLKIHNPLLTLLTPPEYPNAVKFAGMFRWIDDGKREVSVLLKAVDSNGNEVPWPE